MRRTAIGLMLWIVPAVTFGAVDSVIYKGASWWVWLPIFGMAIGFSALLDWYVRESYSAAIERGEA